MRTIAAIVEICGMGLTGTGAWAFVHAHKATGAALACFGVPAFFIGIGMLIGAS